jgi:ABC-type antimicrobial peptide transport system permease subunit
MQMPDGAMALTPRGTGVLVRGTGQPGLFAAIRAMVRGLNGQWVVYGSQTMNEAISDSFAARRSAMALSSVFALVALGLAAIGIYGVTSHLVGRRTQEIGLRLALGASRREVLGLILGQGLRLASGGVALGLAAALVLTRLLAGLLYGTSATDLPTFAAVAVILVLVTLAACYLPARRGTRVDPAVALRCD